MDRAPAVAGRFYPADERELTREVDALIGKETSDEPAPVVIAPHAGYRYSGAIAGEVYRAVRVPPVAIVLCPNHTGHGARAAIMTRGNWIVPGARIPIDAGVAEQVRELALLTDDAAAHAQEHSLEVHLPFLLRRNPRIRIVPICLSALPYASCIRIGTALADVVLDRGRDVLIVASTDMSHYLPVAEAKEQDGLAMARIDALDPEGLYRTVEERDISMCGVVPTTVALVAARALGAAGARLVRYGTSAEVSGDASRVVGYAGYVVR
jgi:AmmeMemoRadiSam system protein B